MYIYELPTTSAVSFSEFCTDQSVNKGYTYCIPEATQARANLHALLKESKRTEHGGQDFLALVKFIEEYLPHLRGIMNCVAHDEIGFRDEPTFSWRSTLSANLFNRSQKLALPGVHADYAFSLLTYAFALSNLSYSTVFSLGTYEHDRAIPDAERRTKDEQLNIAVGFLCKASGIFSFISDSVLPEWQINRAGGPPTRFNKPPELNREVVTALARMSLADAQTLAIRKLLSKSAYDSNIAPGPPLPTSHPSPALIAKLHLECASLYSSARSLAKTPGSSKGSSSSEGNEEVSTDLRKYLADEASFHGALSRKWLGVDAGENGGRAKGGEAVEFLRWAKKDLEDLKDSSKGVSLGKAEKEKKGQKKEKVLDELAKVTVFYKHYKKMNDSLHFQPVPSQNDLQTRIPTGRLAIAARPFSPPAPAFGPGSVDHLRKQAEQLEIAQENISSGSGAEEPTPDLSSASNYAGAGDYF